MQVSTGNLTTTKVVGLYLQVVSYENLVSYLDLSWGYLQGDNLLVFVAGV